MTPVIQKYAALMLVLVLVLVLVHTVHVHCSEYGRGFQLRQNGVPGPNDYHLTFSNQWWNSKNLDYKISPLQLRCYAILYLHKNPTTVWLKTFSLALNQRYSMAFRVIPHFFPYGWRIQCDYRYRAASSKAMKQGIVLTGGSTSQKCLKRKGGCEIVFTYGEARRYSRLGGWEFLGELYESLCFLHIAPCRERDHPRNLFGSFCTGMCHFPCLSHCPDDLELGH